MPPLRENPISWIVTLALVMSLGLFTAAANAQTTVALLGAELAGTCSADSMTLAVSNARSDGLTDEQIANAFGRASTVSTCSETLQSAYQTFVSSSSIDADRLSAAYTSGVNTATRTGIGNPGGVDDGAFNPPSGGSGGGGGSTNE